MTASEELAAYQLEQAVKKLIDVCGDSHLRDGLEMTPARFVNAMQEMTDGYRKDPATILATEFEAAGYDDLVVVSGIPFHSLCEHHLLPFSGHVTIGYLPSGKVVGLSKLPRLVEAYAHRLQIQEGLTTQLADSIETHLNPDGVGIIITAHHSCMSLRGVRSAGEMTTSCMRGSFRTEPSARHELLSIHSNQQRNSP